ncbi:sulfotransferase family protein [Candidatus Mycobacterium methanotrophicum]|uniref:Sulfotransferase n=1 Tax=Candidatus Mycobacterium methanotrophicum TaxID=2943498 RepID=A0ABY4QGN6_9MYCO|nr:sulfotransferase [Candidatus Mycobacterium methanotrophicum]UQX10004.1 sulfotransferase [Candidatus Mycobacterium methanotrophicum]
MRPLGAFALLQVRQVISAATLGLDHLVYPRHRKQTIDRPIFIVGNPRSGTTFLHRLLLGAGDMAAFELWEMLFPAIAARKLLGRIVPRLDRLSPARYHPSDVHDTSLRGIETDDVAWFFRTLDGPFAWAYFLAWQDIWGSELSRREFGIAGVTARENERFFRYYEACWRRNLTLKRANRVLVKSSMLIFRLEELLRRYPDARLVYVVRDPVEVIPSGMSLLASVLENGYDVWNRTNEEDQRRWIENLYQASCAMLRDFHDARTAGLIPERNLCVVRYEDLLQNLEPTTKRILDFIEIEPSEAFREEVRAQAERQRSYTSRHEHSPDQFGLSAERIRADLDFVYDAFGLSDKAG